MDKENIFPTNFGKRFYKEVEEKIPQQEEYQQQDIIPTQQDLSPQQNPFLNMQKYNQAYLPDTPLQGNNGMMEALLNDRDVPENIKTPFWYVFTKDNVLTFLDKERKESKLLNFDITKIDELNSMPYYTYTFEMEKLWNILRNVYETKLDRAFGFKAKDVKNERILLQSQFTEQKMIQESIDATPRDGFFRKLLGRR